MTQDVSLSIALIIALVGFFITVYNWLNTRKKDTQAEDGKLEDIRMSLTTANVKLDSVCATMSDIKTDIKAMNSKIQEQDKEIAMVKRDLATAFKEIDQLRTEVHSQC